MSTPESPARFGDGPERQKALDFCQEFDRVSELFKRSTSDTDRRLAAEAAGLLISRQLYDDVHFRFLVTVPHGFRSEASNDWSVVESDVREFKGTKLEHMLYGNDGFQVDFFNRDPKENEAPWLSVYECYGIKMTPIFPE